MQWTPRPATAVLALGLLSGFALVAGAAGCDQIDCGDGTVEVDGTCEPLLPANCTGEGVRFVNGRCVPDYDSVCGPGTELDEESGQCVSTGGPVADPRPDAGGDADTGGPDVPADGGDDLADGGDDAEDVEDEEVVTFVPDCADDLDPGNRVCIWGQTFNFITGQPLPGDADPPLEVQVKDLVTALGDPTAVVGETLIESGGYFIMPGVDLTGPPQQLIMIVGEREEGTTVEPPGETWQRAISGLIITSDSVDEHGELSLFAIPRSAVAGWNTELGLSPPLPTLETEGFLLARILDAETRQPIEGASFTYGGGGDVELYYFTDVALTDLDTEATETGPAGVAMLRGSSATDFCNATASGYTSTGQVNCGVSPGRVSIVHVLMLSD